MQKSHYDILEIKSCLECFGAGDEIELTTFTLAR